MQKNFWNNRSFFVYSRWSKEKIFLQKRRSGRLNKKWKEDILTALSMAIKKNFTTSIRKHANELKDLDKTVRIAFKQDLKLKLLARISQHFLSMKMKRKKAHKVQKQKKKKTQKFFQENFSLFWLSNLWPPSSPDLNLIMLYGVF